MSNKTCSCGKPAYFGGYCKDCEAILHKALEKELKAEGIFIESDKREITKVRSDL